MEKTAFQEALVPLHMEAVPCAHDALFLFSYVPLFFFFFLIKEQN